MHHSAEHVTSGSAAALFILLTVIPILMCLVYLAFALRGRRAKKWSRWRAISFTFGAVLLILAMSPPVSDWAHGDLRGHMVQHLLLGMFAPIGLVLGAPGTLLLRNVPVKVGRTIVAVLDAPPIRVLIHPFIALLLDIGGMYILYLTPLFALSMSDPVLNVLLHVHFVLAGCLFTWAVAGPDPSPHRPGWLIRLATLFVGMALHANLAKIMYGYGFPRGMMSDAVELQAAAQWMYYGGDLAELLIAIAFFGLLFRSTRLPGSLGEPRVVVSRLATARNHVGRAG